METPETALTKSDIPINPKKRLIKKIIFGLIGWPALIGAPIFLGFFLPYSSDITGCNSEVCILPDAVFLGGGFVLTTLAVILLYKSLPERIKSYKANKFIYSIFLVALLIGMGYISNQTGPEMTGIAQKNRNYVRFNEDIPVIEVYLSAYNINNNMYPNSLDELETQFSITLPKDPKSHKNYQYEANGNNNYKLCALHENTRRENNYNFLVTSYPNKSLDPTSNNLCYDLRHPLNTLTEEMNLRITNMTIAEALDDSFRLNKIYPIDLKSLNIETKLTEKDFSDDQNKSDTIWRKSYYSTINYQAVADGQDFSMCSNYQFNNKCLTAKEMRDFIRKESIWWINDDLGMYFWRFKTYPPSLDKISEREPYKFDQRFHDPLTNTLYEFTSVANGSNYSICFNFETESKKCFDKSSRFERYDYRYLFVSKDKIPNKSN